MEKNNLKWYDTPQVEVVEMETAVSLLAGSGDGVDGDDMIEDSAGGEL